MTRKPAADFKAATRRMYHNLKRRDARCTMTLAEFREWLELQKYDVCLWRCRYCDDFLQIGDVTPDHDVPLKAGGLTLGDNLTTACIKCNQAKNELTGMEFAILRMTLKGLRPEAEAYVLRKLRSPERWYGAHKKRQAAKAKLAGVSQAAHWKGK